MAKNCFKANSVEIIFNVTENIFLNAEISRKKVLQCLNVLKYITNNVASKNNLETF